MHQNTTHMLSVFACLILMMSTGCEEPKDEELRTCLDALPSSCTPQYIPTFENVYENTLSKSCAGGGSSCHADINHHGGLDFSSQASAYETIANPDLGLIIAGDPACSELMIRLESTTSGIAMPPGSPLSPEEKCAIMMWIEQGAMP